jgi:menaquinone-dependent protoporphyrinogen oxidase
VPKPRALVVFHTVEGQSARVATAIATELWSRGIDADVWDTAAAPAPDAYDGVVVGDAIRMEHHSRALRRYLREHHDALAIRPLGLFQVSMTSANDDAEHTETAARLADELIAEVDLHPDVVGLLAGRLAYSQYGWLTRRIMRRISRREGRDTDTSHDHEYTNWEAVEQFADEFARVLVTRTVLD